MPVFNHAFTENMESVFDELHQEATRMFNGMPYCRESFYDLISEAKRCPAGQLPTIKVKLYKMFQEDGITVSPKEDINYYQNKLENSSIPDWEKLTEESHRLFYEKISLSQFPSPGKYIERYVNYKYDKLIEEEKSETKRDRLIQWRDNDSLRLKLLRVFCSDTDGLHAAGYKSQSIWKYVENQIEEKKAKKDYKLLAEKLDENVFSLLDNLRTERDNAYEEYHQYALANGNNKEKKEQLKKEYETCKEACKTMFRKSGPYGLLKLCEDLAQGNFSAERLVREELYLFAVAFDLLFSPGGQNTDRDFEKCFRDYCNSSFLRWITGHSRQIRNGGEEQELTSSGINYKNFLEVIFLYYLTEENIKKPDGSYLSGAERLKKIYNAATEAHKNYTPQETVSKKQKAPSYTVLFEEKVKPHDTKQTSVLYLDENEFIEYITTAYDCSADPTKSVVFDLGTKQNSAVQIYCDLMNDLPSVSDSIISDLFCPEVKKNDKTLRNPQQINLFGNFLSLEEAKDNLEKIDQRLISVWNLTEKQKCDILLYEIGQEFVKNRTAEEIRESGYVSRADIIKLCYWIFLSEGTTKVRSFEEVFCEFSKFCNENLEPAFLSPFDWRNLYDMIIAYSVYIMLNQDYLEKK